MSTTTPNLYLKPTLEQMDTTHQGTKYYAMNTETNPDSTEHNHNIATVSVSGGETGASYSCTAKLTVAVSGAMAEKLTENDAFIKLTGSRTTGLSDTDSSTYDLTKETALSKIVTDDTIYQDMEIGFSLKEGSGTNTATITGDVWLVNTNNIQSGQQAGESGANDISGSTLTVTITVDNLACTIVPSSD